MGLSLTSLIGCNCVYFIFSIWTHIGTFKFAILLAVLSQVKRFMSNVSPKWFT